MLENRLLLYLCMVSAPSSTSEASLTLHQDSKSIAPRHVSQMLGPIDHAGHFRTGVVSRPFSLSHDGLSQTRLALVNQTPFTDSNSAPLRLWQAHRVIDTAKHLPALTIKITYTTQLGVLGLHCLL